MCNFHTENGTITGNKRRYYITARQMKTSLKNWKNQQIEEKENNRQVKTKIENDISNPKTSELKKYKQQRLMQYIPHFVQCFSTV